MFSRNTWRGELRGSPQTNQPPLPPNTAAARLVHPISLSTRRRRRKRCFLCALLIVVPLVVTFTVLPRRWDLPDENRTSSGEALRTCDDLLRLPGDVGFSRPPLESTVLLLFDSNHTHIASATGSDADGTLLQRWFETVSEAFLSVRAPIRNVTTTAASEQTDPAPFLANTAATAWVVDRARREAVPLKIDVVYTYVNQSTPAFASRLHQRGSSAVHTKFFRDWGELRYSLRSLWHAAMDPTNAAFRLQHQARRARDERALAALGLTARAHVSTHTTRSCSFAAPFSVVRRVILVVAADDQIPHWLSTDPVCGVEIVHHATLFTAEEQANGALPTFNSLAIESTLHRIPGLSRFWWYFNNDMLLGQPVSFFDLFRPLSPPRQRTHFQSYTADVGAENTPADISRTLPRGCAALWMEPLIHSDHSNAFSIDLLPQLDRMTWSSYLQSMADPFLSDSLVHTVDRTKRCVVEAMSAPAKERSPWRTTTFITPNSVRPPLACRHALNLHAHYVTKTSLEGVPPTMMYAHLPQLIDTALFARMLEDPVDGLTDEARRIRLSFHRDLNNFSPVHVYGYYALAMRRAVERDLWRRLRHTMPAAVSSQNTRFLGRDATTTTTESFAFCQACPLCTHTNAVNLQHPELYLELAAWWPRKTSLSTADALRCRADVLSGDDKAAERLKRHYLSLVGRHEQAADEATITHLDSERLPGLLADVFHHVNDGILRFLMIEDLLQLAMKVYLMEASTQQSNPPPLFTTINDDIPHEYVQSALSDPHSWHSHARLFGRLLRLSSYHGDTRCPFERID